MALSEKELIEIRRRLHQIPEIGMEEFETQKMLLAIIEKLPHDFMKIKTWKTAIIVHLTGSKGQTTIGYRTDIDGLPVEEKTGLPFSLIGKCTALYGLSRYFSSLLSFSNIVNFIYFSIPCSSQYR